MRYTEHDTVCIPVPMYHCFGMVIGVLACLTHGSAIVFPGEGFDPLATLQTVAEDRCTSLYGVPTMFIAELDHPDFEDFDLTSLRTGMMAGAPCPIEVMRRCIRDMHLTEMTIGYGMTETSPVSTQTRIGDTLEQQSRTVGRAHPHVEIKIVDADGRIVPRGATGEFCTRGYSVMLGYWDDTERTARGDRRAGWMHTGDLATMDGDGYCTIVGRIKDMVIRGGENIYPREIEEFLYRHPAILDVQVFGVPDQRFGEELCAWIKLRSGGALTEDEVKAFCKDQIAHYKVPRYIRFVDEFPMTVTGKMQKFLMRARMTEELGSTERRLSPARQGRLRHRALIALSGQQQLEGGTQCAGLVFDQNGGTPSYAVVEGDTVIPGARVAVRGVGTHRHKAETGRREADGAGHSADILRRRHELPRACPRSRREDRTAGQPADQPDIGYRANNALIAHGETIVIPADATEQVQYEGELVVVIGRKCKNLTRENALSAVLGWTIGNDVSERTWQKADRTMWRAKNTDTFKPMGPWIETDVKLEDLRHQDPPERREN